MRLLNTFARIIAALSGLLLLTACPDGTTGGGEDNDDAIISKIDKITVPDESLSVFNSGLSLGPEATSATVSFTTTSAWELSVNMVKASSWLKIDPMSGPAGAAKISVSVVPDDSEHEADIVITCGSVSKSFKLKVAAKPADPGVKAAYEEFLGHWYVEGTEHTWFYGSGGTPVTARYIINIKQDEAGTGYLIEDWETAADASYAVPNYTNWTNFVGEPIFSVFSFYKIRMYTDLTLKAKYDADRGSLTISRQDFRTDSGTTTMFLGDTYTSSGHVSQGGTDYIVCEYRKMDDGSFRILPGSVGGVEIGSMGYAQYRTGWADHFNKDFALPLTMTKAENVATSIKAETGSKVLNVGESVTLGYTLTPETADKSHVRWYSPDTSIATVDASGKVTGIAQGHLIIYVSADGCIGRISVVVM